MNKVDYNHICSIYDDVRKEEVDIIRRFFQESEITENSNILDIGCGTGNYTNLIQKVSKAKVYGMDPSQGMLEKAREKNNEILFKVGQASCIPFEGDKFDFIYMTDVIHHIPDINFMFCEIYRVLKNGGKMCIATQSHRQIDIRYMSEFFPATAVVDKKRYPDIDSIITSAEESRMHYIKQEIVGEGQDVELGAKYLELLEKKGYSMLHLINDEDYMNGVNRVKAELREGSIVRKSAGDTLIWFLK